MNKRSVSSFLLLGLFGIFFINLISAATLSDALSKVPVLSSIVDALGNNSAGLALILLVALVVLAVYSVTSFIPIIDSNEVIKWAFSVIVGILCFFYVDITTIRTILITYETLGVVLTSVIPFLIIVVFTIKIETDDDEKSYLYRYIIANLAFWGFMVYLFVKLFQYYAQSDKTLSWIYGLTLLAGIIWLIIKKYFIRKAKEAKLKKEVEEAQTTVDKSTAAIIMHSKELEDLAKRAMSKAPSEKK